MTELVLAGCRTAPLGSYLTGLGLLRAVSRLLDPDALGCWRGGRFVLHCGFGSVEALAQALLDQFTPQPIVSPWNAGSGFAGNGKNSTAESLLQRVRDSAEPRWSELRTAVAAGDEVVRIGRAESWGGRGGELWDTTRKADVLRLCRNRFPDAALPWVDAAVAVGAEAEPTYSRLLGTGGNFGRQDLSVTYLSRAFTAFEDRRSSRWLMAALTGDEAVPYQRDAVGQFDPGKAGGVQSSPWEKADDKGFVNPWGFLLTVEGALLFAGATVRRLGARHPRPSLPFQVYGSSGGFATTALDETPLGEIWTPEWSVPAGIGEISHLLAEGRAEWQDNPARSGLDFARAVATLGVDRSLDAFTRHVFVDRHGQSPLAVPAGRIRVTDRSAVGLLAELDPWLARLTGPRIPAAVTAGTRLVGQRLFGLATGESDLGAVFAALGRLVETVHRSGAARAETHPLILRRGRELFDALGPLLDDDADLRVALALATLQDAEPGQGLRSYLHPVAATGPGRRWEWAHRSSLAPLGGGLGPCLAEAARRRSFPGAVTEHVADDVPAVRGCRVTYARGARLGLADRDAIVHRTPGEQRLGDLLSGLLCVEWPGMDRTRLPDHAAVPDPALDLLLPFAQAGSDPVLVRPGATWAAQLAAGRVDDVLADATHRLRLTGRRWVVTAHASGLDGPMLAGSLLLPTTPEQRRAALDRASHTDEEISA